MPNIINIGGGGGSAGAKVTAIAGENIIAGEAIEYYAYPGAQELADPIVHTNTLAISPNGRYRVEYSATTPFFLVYDGDTLLEYADGEAPTGAPIITVTGGQTALFSYDSKYLAIVHADSALVKIYSIGDTLELSGSVNINTLRMLCESPVAHEFLFGTIGTASALTRVFLENGAWTSQSTTSVNVSAGPNYRSIYSADGNVACCTGLYNSVYRLVLFDLPTGTSNDLTIKYNSSQYWNGCHPITFNADGSKVVYFVYAGANSSVLALMVDAATKEPKAAIALPETQYGPSSLASGQSYRYSVLPTPDPQVFRIIANLTVCNALLHVDFDNNELGIIKTKNTTVPGLSTNLNCTHAVMAEDKSRAYLQSPYDTNTLEFLFGDTAVVRKLRNLTDAQIRARNAYGWHGIGYAKTSASAGQEVEIELLTDISDAMRG